ncbi:rhodanese-like domain-containing protein [Motiliproteus coralliicola]|uniref:rhodanese-like domain-containing protein n=1 Tax=Motiliproteus coralliicola TaxID=2283196 RepID=UPI0014022CA6|nr:rhodanese-like domain-containing protein [Motiliproteus coralliicola]
MSLLRLLLPLIALSLLSNGAIADSREAKAWQLIEQGALVIDVRTTEEYAQAHLKSSVHIPYPEIVARFSQMEIRKDLPIVLYCRSGNRSGIAYKMLSQAGYTALHNGGGLNDLLQAAPR